LIAYIRLHSLAQTEQTFDNDIMAAITVLVPELAEPGMQLAVHFLLN